MGEHGLIYNQVDLARLVNYSAARCPTFGNCKNCLRAGPLGKLCLLCPRNYYCCIYTGTIGLRDNLIDAQRLNNRIAYNGDIEQPNVD